MNDLISKTVALDAINGIKQMQGNMEQLAMKALCWAAVKIIKPVDAAPVVHGRWVYEHSDPAMIPCSVCGYQVFRYNNTHYCPNCGAKMDGERRESE